MVGAFKRLECKFEASYFLLRKIKFLLTVSGKVGKVFLTGTDESFPLSSSRGSARKRLPEKEEKKKIFLDKLKDFWQGVFKGRAKKKSLVLPAQKKLSR